MRIFQIMFLTTAIIGCESPGRGNAPKITSAYTQVAQYSSARLKTIKHDGHLYVVATNVESISVIHSPACPCSLKAEHAGQKLKPYGVRQNI